MDKKIIIATPIYYANGSPHIGHFLTTTIADILARYYRSKLGEENVFFTTGLDEHGTTVEQSALKEGYDPENFQKYTDVRAIEWKQAFDETSISYDYFVRTTHPEHKNFSQRFIKKLINAGDVYKSTYLGKYCWGCEKFLTLSDQDETGSCPLHRPDQVEEIQEENYFFKLSKYAQQIKELIKKDEIKIKPHTKRKEIIARLEGEIEDLSISRPKAKVSWGIEFPDDPGQTIYVWTEALLNYLSSLEINQKQDFYPNLMHVLGKDINWFHNVVWPALLISAGYELYKESFVHSFINISGQKISKSLGNVISPTELMKKYSIDGARYLSIKNLPYKNDTNITWEAMNQVYDADLANGIGNLVSRVAAMVEKTNITVKPEEKKISEEIGKHVEAHKLHSALEYIWDRIRTLDKYINENEVWAQSEKDKEVSLLHLIEQIRQIATDLKPFLPEVSEKIQAQFKGPKIKKEEPLFPRLD